MKKYRVLTAALCAAFLLCGMAAPAHAYSDEPTGGYTGDDPAPTEEDVTLEPGEGFSEEGDLVTRDLLYDKHTNKQFITVQTKAGNTFYIIIDRAADGENTVYFLNAVDEADLMALMEDGEPAACDCTTKCTAGAVDTTCPVCAVNMTECVGPEPEPEPEPTPEPVEEPAEESSGLNPAVLLVVLLVLGGGGAFAYFKLVKGRKAGTKGPDNLDDYDYGEDDEEYEDSLADNEDEDGEDKGT